MERKWKERYSQKFRCRTVERMNACENTVFGQPISGQSATFSSEALYAPGMGIANVATGGRAADRINGYFNPAAFCAPTNVPSNPCFAVTPQPGGPGSGFGYGSDGYILGPRQFNTDLTLAKVTKVGGLREDATLQFRAEFYNAFNHPQFSNPGTGPNTGGVNFASPAFGKITSLSVNPRLIQFGLKYVF